MAPDLLIGTAAVVLLVLPGWLVARAWRVPLPVVAGFVAGAVGLVLLVQLLDALGLGLRGGTLIPAWLVLVAGALGVPRRAAAAEPTPAEEPAAARPRSEWWLWLPVLPGLAVVAYRAIAQPLFGVDTVFRWNFLAEQMLARGTLAFYPPVSPADYAVYAWPDGIAPAVSSLYFWAYTLAGAARPGLTAPLIIVQFLLLLAVTHALTRRLASARAAVLACGLVACSPLLLWSIAMGEESALLALALLGLLFYLPASRETESTAPVLVAGLAAALGGLAREYGLAFVLFGLALGVSRRLSGRTLLVFLLTAAAGTLPWYGRNWLHTGNPFFNLDVAGIFPVNAAHLRLMRVYQASFGWTRLPPEALRIFLTNCAAALVAGTAGACLCFRPARPVVAAILLTAVLWAAALGYTAAGFTYSLRVLTPALFLAAILGGLALARWVPGRRYLGGLLLALTIFAADSALRALVLPANPYRVPVSAWSSVGGAIQAYHRRPVYRELARWAGDRRILVLGPAALLNDHGAHTVPLWSPEVACLWDGTLPATEVARRLRAAGIELVLLNKGEVNREYLAESPFFHRDPAAVLQPLWGDEDMTLFEVKPTVNPAPGGARP